MSAANANVFDAKVPTLIAADQLAEAANRLLQAIPPGCSSLHDDATALLGELARLERQIRRHEITAESASTTRIKIAYRLLDLNRDTAAAAVLVDTPNPAPAAVQKTVFISYSHADSDTAHLVATALERAGFAVRTDYASMRAGQDISTFVKSSIRDTCATVCILSEASLLSGWVAQETMLALLVADLWGERQFIACYLDDRFLDIGFRLAATARIDAKLEHLHELKSEHAKHQIDTVDLDAEHARLSALRYELGTVLHNVRKSLSLDLRENQREASLSKLVAALNREDQVRRP